MSHQRLKMEEVEGDSQKYQELGRMFAEYELIVNSVSKPQQDL